MDYKSTRLYLGASFIQIIAMLILIVIVYQNINEIIIINYYNTDDSEESFEAYSKRLKMIYEAMMCMIFESWKCILILNAVLLFSFPFLCIIKM